MFEELNFKPFFCPKVTSDYVMYFTVGFFNIFLKYFKHITRYQIITHSIFHAVLSLTPLRVLFCFTGSFSTLSGIY